MPSGMKTTYHEGTKAVHAKAEKPVEKPEVEAAPVAPVAPAKPLMKLKAIQFFSNWSIPGAHEWLQGEVREVDWETYLRLVDDNPNNWERVDKMGTEIRRNQSMQIALFDISEDAALSNAIDFSQHAGGVAIVPTGWTDANIGFKVSESKTGTFVILRDDTGVPVQISSVLTSAARAYALPDKLFGALWVKFWSKSTTAGTETDTNQTTADKSITVMMKG